MTGAPQPDYSDAAARYDDKAANDLRLAGFCLAMATAFGLFADDTVAWVTVALWLLCGLMFVGSYRWHRRAADTYRWSATVHTELDRLRGEP